MSADALQVRFLLSLVDLVDPSRAGVPCRSRVDLFRAPPRLFDTRRSSLRRVHPQAGPKEVQSVGSIPRCEYVYPSLSIPGEPLNWKPSIPAHLRP